MPSFLLPELVKADNIKGVVCQPEDGETVYVRESTPITIQVSGKKDSVESISICTEEIQPGNKIPVHKHLHEDEFFIFLKGSGTIDIDGVEFPVKAGTSGFVPRATWHSIITTVPKYLFSVLAIHHRDLKISSGKSAPRRECPSKQKQKRKS